MSVRRYGPTQGAGVVVIEQESEKLIDPAPLGVTLYMTPLERGQMGKLISCFSKSDFKAKCGRRIDGFDGPDCAQDFWEHGNGAGELHLVRIAKATARAAQTDVYSREGLTSRAVMRIHALSPGRWGSRKRTIWREVSNVSVVTETQIPTGITMLQDEWVGGFVALDGVPSKVYEIVSNSTAGVVNVRTDSTMDTDLGVSSDKGYQLTMATPQGPEGLKRALSYKIADGETNPTSEFSMQVFVHQEFVRGWGNLSMDPASKNYFVNVINDDLSNEEISVEDLLSPNNPAPPSVRPANEQGSTASVSSTVLSSKMINAPRVIPIGGTTPNPTLAIGTTSDVVQFRDTLVFECTALSAAAATAGSSTSAAATSRIIPAQHTDVSIDQGANQVWTWSGTRGFKSGAGGVFAGVAGTFTLRLNEDPNTDIPITFAGTENSLAKALAAINDQWPGGSAVDTGAGQIKLQSDRFGSSSSVRIVAGGTALLLTDLGFTAGLGTAGTATCTKTGGTGTKTVTIAFLDAATPAEIVAAIAAADAITGATWTAPTPTTMAITTTTTGATPKGVHVQGASTNSLGFDNAEHNGIAAVAGGQATLSLVSKRVGGGTSVHAAVTANNTNSTAFAFTSPTSPLVPPLTLTVGTVVFAVGDKVEVDYMPYEPGALIGGYLIPDWVGSPNTLFLISDNDHKSITCASGGLVDTGSGAVDDKFMVIYKQELGGSDRDVNNPCNGYDGLAGLNDNDYTTTALSPSDSPAREMLTMNKGLVKVATPDRNATSIVKAGVNFAEAMNWQFRVELPDTITDEATAINQVNNTVGRNDFAVTIFPSYVYVNDPDKDGVLKLIPATGMVHGREALMAKNFDGYHKAAAGIDVQLPRVVKTTLAASKVLNEEALNPQGLNIIKKTKGNFVVWGDRTLYLDPAWKWKHQREQMSHYENRLREGFDFIVFALNNTDTQILLLTTLKAFFLPEFNKGAIRGKNFDDAISLKIDGENNTNATRAAGDLFADIKLRLADTVERFVIRIGKAGIFESLS